MQNQLAILLVGFAQHSAELAQKLSIFARTAPNAFIRGLLFEQIWQYGRFFAFVEELIKWDFASPCHLFKRFDGGKSMTILDACDIATEQASTLFAGYFGTVLCLPHFPESSSSNHC